ncbi:tRNA-dihydrouridine synthase family protein [Fibrobacter sp. UWR2]|uniref:tRNA-dihydrouridine synthase family protein n=1 Tax=Fibrobacter sp. UWR2 TaxID=1964352 RepID=UPI000B52587D|nr:tRNA-dihydrouridine synthase family protein [Fibrobacter sp. UWR2]OWU99636.1 dihydrouridine synthase [Fibrobacter sp. UWR2]
MQVLFAPLQGYTTGIYRKVHAEIFGGVDAYYAPFLRIENGHPREKDLRDLDGAIDCKLDGGFDSIGGNCNSVARAKTVPQIIANSAGEFKVLADAILQKGFTEIDFNMGCPFPMQVSRHRGAGLLNDTRTVQEIMDEIARLSAAGTARFSVKMRLGQDSPDEAFALLPILNDAPLTQITLHPRLGRQQYKGALDIPSFEKFYNECRHPLIYNGDITSVGQIRKIESGYPKLAGIMIGRGMLARPSLAAEYKAATDANAVSENELLSKILKMHGKLYEHARSTYQGDSQILSHIRSFWDYLEPSLPKKVFKKIQKAGKLNEYDVAIQSLNMEQADG